MSEKKTTRTDARKRPVTASKIDAADLSAKRRAASAKGLAARWGDARGKSRQVRVDEAAYNALQIVPERERREFASRAIIAAVDRLANPS